MSFRARCGSTQEHDKQLGPVLTYLVSNYYLISYVLWIGGELLLLLLLLLLLQLQLQLLLLLQLGVGCWLASVHRVSLTMPLGSLVLTVALPCYEWSAL